LKKIIKLVVYIINIPLYLIAKLIPKDEKLWIFGAWFGEKYADNSKYLFEYVNKNHPEVRAVWLTKNINILNQLNKDGYEVYKTYSIKSILLGLRAKYSIFVHSNNVDNLLFLNNSKTMKIQLWHGTPLKKIGFDDKLAKQKQSKLKFLLFPFFETKYDLMISMSEKDRENFYTAFQTSNIVITGYPRNDNLLTKMKNEKFTITYLPTFRDNIGDKIDLFSEYNFNLEKWKNILSQNNIVLNIKMHPVNKPKDELLLNFKNCKNIAFLEEIDVAEVLPNTDLLITDYSSVFFDFLLTNRPIIFTPFDYDKYITKDRELYYNYDEVTPGPKCKNWEEVLMWIVKFKEQPELFKDERTEAKNIFHKYQDGKSCKRVYNEIIALDKN
jgi:CDP-glycerol glycerophosphotransferase